MQRPGPQAGARRPGVVMGVVNFVAGAGLAWAGASSVHSTHVDGLSSTTGSGKRTLSCYWSCESVKRDD